MGEKKTFTCSNPACAATFGAPLKTLNLQDNPAEPYYACPVCLTRVEDVNLKVLENPSQAVQKKQEPASAEKPVKCRHHLGYLSERVQNEQIPDGCLTCTSIVECMLKKMRDE